jgi:uncharacterized phiE125 gp8 family phage protein
MLKHSLRRILEPSSEPVTLAEAKRQCNVIADDEDTQFDHWIQAARELTESAANRSLMLQTWRLRIHDWPLERLELPRPPLIAVSSVEYYDSAGVEQTLPATYYAVDSDREPGVLWRDEDAIWPATGGQPNAISIVYTAGYASAAAVPARAKQAILLLVAHWYRVREAVGTVGDEVALAYQSLIRSLKPGGYP